MEPSSLLSPGLALVLSPLLLGTINRVKALFAGRTGPPLLQTYFDIAKLLRKGAVYSTTSTWVVRAGPAVVLASTLCALALVPLGPLPAPVSFAGDLILLVGLLALSRFFLMLAALDTGSSFEGMGASREAFFATLAEPPLIVGLLVAARGGGSLSLSGLLGADTMGGVASGGPPLLLVVVALYLVFLAENARIPVDDPNTHLELTMIHEVMVLDHTGVDMAYITFAGCLKMWILGSIVVGLIVPAGGLEPVIAVPAVVGALFLLAVVTGVVESTTARVRMGRVPRLLVGAGGLAAVALLFVVY